MCNACKKVHLKFLCKEKKSLAYIYTVQPNWRSSWKKKKEQKF